MAGLRQRTTAAASLNAWLRWCWGGYSEIVQWLTVHLQSRSAWRSNRLCIYVELAHSNCDRYLPVPLFARCGRAYLFRLPVLYAGAVCGVTLGDAVLFICGGAFAGLDKIIEQRIGHKGVGFHATVKNKAEKEAGDLFAQVLPEDLLSYGLIPEFVGRLPMVGAVHNLDKPALIKILTEPKNALLKQFQKFFEFEDIELEITPDAMVAIADQALSRGTGARGLRAILEEVLLNTMYELPGRTDVAKVIVDVDSVVSKAEPTIVPRSTRVARQRRAAS